MNHHRHEGAQLTGLNAYRWNDAIAKAIIPSDQSLFIVNITTKHYITNYVNDFELRSLCDVQKIHNMATKAMSDTKIFNPKTTELLAQQVVDHIASCFIFCLLNPYSDIPSCCCWVSHRPADFNYDRPRLVLVADIIVTDNECCVGEYCSDNDDVTVLDFDVPDDDQCDEFNEESDIDDNGGTMHGVADNSQSGTQPLDNDTHENDQSGQEQEVDVQEDDYGLIGGDGGGRGQERVDQEEAIDQANMDSLEYPSDVSVEITSEDLGTQLSTTYSSTSIPSINDADLITDQELEDRIPIVFGLPARTNDNGHHQINEVEDFTENIEANESNAAEFNAVLDILSDWKNYNYKTSPHTDTGSKKRKAVLELEATVPAKHFKRDPNAPPGQDEEHESSQPEAELKSLLKFKPTLEIIRHEKDATDGNQICSICLEEKSSGKVSVRLIRCNHVFHSTCIYKWLLAKHSCPYCRTHTATAVCL